MKTSSVRLRRIIFLTCSFAVLLGNTNAAQISGPVEDRFSHRGPADAVFLSVGRKGREPGLQHLFTGDGVMERYRDGNLVPESKLLGNKAIFDYAHASHHGRLGRPTDSPPLFWSGLS